MMFFRNFPMVSYEFGDTGISATVENLAIYADVIDQVADATSSYIDYNIQNGQRMDQVCLDLYDAPEYMWTILLLNRNLRELGWPLTNQQAYEKAIELYGNYTVITTRTPLTDKLAVGQEISGLTSGQTATITHRILDYGQIWVEGNIAFRNGETITSQNSGGGFENAIVTTVQRQYEAVHHYENADKEWVDIDPTVGPGAQITPITYMDNYIRHNDEQKRIKVFKPSVINSVVESFFEAIR